jgi:hypothetical protein
MNDYKKFESSEIVIGILFWLGIDLLAMILDLTIIGYFFATPIQALSSFIISFWLSKKGNKKALKINKQLTKQLMNFLPVLPTVTTSFIIEVIRHNKQK